MNLPVQTLGPFARGQPGIAANPAVQRAAFSDALIQDGTVSDPIEIGPEHSVLIRVTEHTRAQALPLAQVRKQVIAAIRLRPRRQGRGSRRDAMVAHCAPASRCRKWRRPATGIGGAAGCSARRADTGCRIGRRIFMPRRRRARCPPTR